MLRRITLRLALPAVLAVTLLPATASAQSQDSESVAEAARKARAQKKNPEKPPKVITDETLDVKKGDVQSAVAEQPRMPGTPDTPAQPAGTANAPAQDSKNASEEEKARAALKERVALKEKIKAAQNDLDLLQREYQLDQESYYSSTDYAKNIAGKDKLDALKQQISDKHQEIEQLKTKLAALPAPQESTQTTPKS
jgi:superfamily II RNA helicase